MSTIVECSAVTKTYQQGQLQFKAVNAISLQVQRGEFLSLSGPSGSGKTTLLNIIGGLDRLTQGQVTVAGQRVDQMSLAQLADMRLHKLGFVFQSYNLIPVLTALENIEFIMQLQGVQALRRRQRAQKVLEEVGLTGLGHRRPSELSGGQQQRVSVARAIASRPQLVLADEPTANLDSTTAQELLQLMTQLNQTHQVTFIISTHDSRIIDYTSRHIQLRDGQIIADEVD
ncbi:MAG: ABC transporter ATP-binding protein [Pseudomonadota bacterium]|nr:ABC transporter ATP-binding protein [Pseudomonadota bacterium]